MCPLKYCRFANENPHYGQGILIDYLLIIKYHMLIIDSWEFLENGAAKSV